MFICISVSQGTAATSQSLVATHLNVDCPGIQETQWA